MPLKRRRSPSSAADAATTPAETAPVATPTSHSSPLSSLVSHPEIFFRVLGFLSAPDLANVQSVSRYWQHMSLDQQLWKRLYLSRYPHPHHSRLLHTPTSTPSRTSAGVDAHRPSTPASGSSTPRTLRPISRLPSRAFPPPSPSPSPSPSTSSLHDVTAMATGMLRGKGKSIAMERGGEREADEIGTGVRNDGVDWKLMLRLGTNWLHGNASTEDTYTLPPSPSPSVPSLSLDQEYDESHEHSQAGTSEQQIALSPAFIFTSNPSSPLVQVHASNGGAHIGLIPPPPGWSSPHRPDNVTAIAIDQAVPDDVGVGSQEKSAFPARLAVFYQSGGFAVLYVRSVDGRLVWSREAVSPPTSRPVSLRRRATMFTPQQGDHVVLAALHWPVLVTCTRAFHLGVYALSTSGHAPSRPRLLRSLHSDVSHHPATLSLLPLPSINNVNSPTRRAHVHLFRAALTYCTPVYPSSWTVAVQELEIDLAAAPLVASLAHAAQDGRVHRGECLTVGYGDGTEADDDPFVWPRRVRPVVGVKGTAAGVGSDGRWCVLAGRDGLVEVFALPETGVAQDEQGGDARIAHVCTLGAQQARGVESVSMSVSALALDAGRCVTGGTDGRVLLWDLDGMEEDEGLAGRTVGFVEVRKGQGRKGRKRGARPKSSLALVKGTGMGQVGAGAPGAPGVGLGYRDDENENGHEDEDEDEDEDSNDRGVPHPKSVSAVARAWFLPCPPDELIRRHERDVEEEQEQEQEQEERDRAVIRHLSFDEEKIVGMVRNGGAVGELMKVWRFS